MLSSRCQRSATSRASGAASLTASIGGVGCWNSRNAVVDGVHQRDRSAVIGSRVALGLAREARGGSVQLFKELRQGRGCRLEVVEP